MKSEKGFTLIEVMIAMAIFAIFTTVYVVREGYNVESSSFLREEKKIKDLCQAVIDETISSDIELKESLLLTPSIKTFEDHPNYEYTVAWSELEIPDFTATSEDSETQESEGMTGIESSLSKQVSENMKKLIWQLNVSVKNKTTGYTYDLSTWLYNDKAKVQFGAM